MATTEAIEEFATSIADYVATHSNYLSMSPYGAAVAAIEVLCNDIGAAQGFLSVIGIDIDLYAHDGKARMLVFEVAQEKGRCCRCLNEILGGDIRVRLADLRLHRACVKEMLEASYDQIPALWHETAGISMETAFDAYRTQLADRLGIDP